MNKIIVILIALGILLSVLSSTTFVVNQRQYAIVFALGEVKKVISQPGLHFKLPPPLQNVIYLDNRIQTLATPEDERFITAEKKNIMIDAYVKWRIADPRLFYISFGGDQKRAHDRLLQITKAALNEEVSKLRVHQVISSNRENIMATLKKKIAEESKQIGVNIIDVRLTRVEYVEQINNSVYERMRAERMRVANELRSTGYAESEKIRADADKQRVVILADAYRDAEKIRGFGDAKASEIYGKAFGKNPEFYDFYRSLEAYRATFKNKSDVLVIDPHSEFFQYFKQDKTGAKK